MFHKPAKLRLNWQPRNQALWGAHGSAVLVAAFCGDELSFD
jgi:hypothetical protein